MKDTPYYLLLMLSLFAATVLLGVIVGDVDPVSDETQMELNRK